MKFYYERCKDRHGPLKSACQCFCPFFSWTFVKCTNKLYLLLFLCAVYVYTFSVRGFFFLNYFYIVQKQTNKWKTLFFYFFFSFILIIQTEKKQTGATVGTVKWRKRQKYSATKISCGRCPARLVETTGGPFISVE